MTYLSSVGGSSVYFSIGHGRGEKANIRFYLWQKLRGKHGYGLLAFGQMVNLIILMQFSGYEGVGFVMNQVCGIWYGGGSFISLLGMITIVRYRYDLDKKHSKWVLLGLSAWILGFVLSLITISIVPDPRVPVPDSAILKFSIMVMVVTLINILVVLALVIYIFPRRLRIVVISAFVVLITCYVVNHAVAYPKVEHVYHELADYAASEESIDPFSGSIFDDDADDEKILEKYYKLTEPLSIHFYIDFFLFLAIWLTVGLCAFLFSRAKKGWRHEWELEGEYQEGDEENEEDEIFEEEDDALPGEVEYEETDEGGEKEDVLDRLYHK